MQRGWRLSQRLVIQGSNSSICGESCAYNVFGTSLAPTGAEARADAASQPREPQAVEELLGLDAMEIEIGYGLVQIVDAARGGDLLERISMVRRQLAVEIGMVVPPIRIRDNMQLDANAYRVKLRGAVIGEGTIYPGLMMAMEYRLPVPN